MEDDPRYHIVKAKNKFETPNLTGYRDLNFCIQVRVPAAADNTTTTFNHVCEIQIHHAEIYKLNSQLHSHDYYEFMRSYFAGDTGSLQERLDDLRRISGGASVDESFVEDLLNKNLNQDRLLRLAELFEEQLCEYDWSLRVHEKLLEVRISQNDPLPIVASYLAMGKVLRLQSKFQAAIDKFDQAIRLINPSDGENIDGHTPILANVFYEMGVVLQLQGKLDDALLVERQALEYQTEALGKYHADVATTYRGLGLILEKQGMLDKAMKMYEQALKIRTKTMGEGHWIVGDCYRSMAIVLCKKGELGIAFGLFEMTLDLYEKNFGRYHISVSDIHTAMANVYFMQGKLDEALAKYEWALKIRKKVHGDEHWTVAGTYANMAMVLQKQQKLKEAFQLLELALEMRLKFLGEKAPEIAKTYSAMASVCQDLGNEEEANAFLEKASKTSQ